MMSIGFFISPQPSPLLAVTSAVIMLLFELLALNPPSYDTCLSAGSDSWIGVGALVFIVLILGWGFVSNKKKQSTVYDMVTLRAKDEREQQLIDHAGRKAYAFVRLFIPVLVIAVMFTSFFKTISLSLTQVIWLLILITFVGEWSFRFFTRNIPGN